MFYEEIFSFIIIVPIIAILIMLILCWINVKKSEEDSDELYKQLIFKRQVEKAR